ncbi:MAG: hypothetical protein K1X28_05595 [Parachlamydiales bacterium]|nr:hypothetical protein [Parachlamydiales bacterium]
MSTTPSQQAEQALQQIEQQFQAALAAIAQIQADTSQQSQDLRNAAYDKAHEHSHRASYVGGTVITYTVTNQWAVDGYNAAMADYSAKAQDINNQNKLINGLGSQFQTLTDAINNLMSMMASLVKNNNVGGDLIGEDLDSMNKVLQSLFKGLRSELMAWKDQADMTVGIDDGLSAAFVGQCISDMASNQTAEYNDLISANNVLKGLLNTYMTQYNNALEDESSYSIWDMLNPFGDAGSEMSKDQKIMDNAQAMMKGILSVMDTIAQVTSNLMPEFTTIVNEIEEIIRDVKKFLAEFKTATPAQKAADIKQILAEIMYVLTQVQTLKQEIENNKAKNNQDMSQGTIQASKNNVDETIAQQKIEEEQKKAAAAAKIFQIVMTCVMGAVMMVASGGAGAALLTGLVTLYEALNDAGVLNTNQDLAGAMHSQIGADIVIGVTEALVTFGAGMGVDMALASVKAGEKAVMSAVSVAMESSEEEIEEQADKIATKEANNAMSKVELPQIGDEEAQAAYKAAEKEAYDNAYSKAYDELYAIAESAAKKAAERMGQQFLKQQFGTLVELAVSGEFKQTLEKLMEQAAKDAIGDAVEESSTIAKLAARGVESNDQIIGDITDRNANQSVSKITGKSPDSIQSDSSLMGWGTKRFLALLVAGLLGNNIMTDSAKKMGADDDAWYTQLISVLQSLMQMIAMMGGTGTFSSVSIDGIMSKLPRYATLLSTIPQGAQAINDVSLYETDEAQGKALTAIQKLEGESGLLNDFLQMLQKDATSWGNMIKEVEQDQADTNQLAGHMNDGQQAEINVLIASIG